MIKHYAKVWYPGAFVSEGYEIPVQNRDCRPKLPRGAYAYMFMDREEVKAPNSNEILKGDFKNHSKFFVIGEVYTKEMVKAIPKEKRGVLLDNMESNRWETVVKCAQGFLPIDKNTVVIPPEK